MVREGYYFGIAVVCCIIMIVGISGCLGSGFLAGKNTVHSEPETGIYAWVEAMNAKDIERLYVLTPSKIRSSITKTEFIQANKDNEFLKPEVAFTGVEILKKSYEGENATIAAHINLKKGDAEPISLFYTFHLVFENGEWKIWTSKF